MYVMCFSDIDDCDTNPCLNGGTCQDEVNGYTCNCVAGFNGATCNNGKRLYENIRSTSTEAGLGSLLYCRS